MSDFFSNLYTLTHDDVVKMSKDDGGRISNVLRGLSKHCFALAADFDEGKSIDFIFIVDSFEKPGHLLRLTYKQESFYDDLLAFSTILSQEYEDLDIINVYNTFIGNFRTFLEANNIFTITSTELSHFKGRSFEMMSPYPIEVIQTVEKEDFYKVFLNAPSRFDVQENRNYVYVMLNRDTGLFKIGRSKNPYYREGTLQSKEPNIVLLKAWECDKKVETQIQKLYTKKRVRGEWFKLNIKDLSDIDALIEGLTK